MIKVSGKELEKKQNQNSKFIKEVFMTFKKRYFSAAGAVLVAVGLWTLPVYAQSGARFHGSGGMMLPLLLRGANLTADQKAQVHQIKVPARVTW